MLLRGGQSNNNPSGTSAGSTTGSVHISLVLGGWIYVQHKRNIIDVDSARSHIRGDQDTNPAARKFRQVLGTNGLGEITMKLN